MYVRTSKKMEIWKSIRYASDYQVSNFGNLKNKKGRPLLVNYDRLRKTNTRAQPGFWVDGQLKQYYLHRIVAEHFIENENNCSEVNHIDGDCYNNVASNLEWVTKLENMRHANENGLIKRFTTRIKATHKQTGEVTEYESASECSVATGVSNPRISQCCRGVCENKVYTFEYKDCRRRLVFEDSETIWKEFPEFTEYLVSTTGEVKHKKNGNILNGSLVNGYRTVYLKGMNRLVHRMVAMTFLENPENLPVVDHIDTNPLNNDVRNLKWCSYKDNMNNQTTLDKMKSKKKIDSE